MERNKLIYIAGDGRSGGTLVGQMLNSLDDFVYVGELRNIWVESIEQNDPCGCGERFRDCEFWRKVIEQAFGAFERIDYAAMMKSYSSVAKERYSPLLLFFNRAPLEFLGSRRPHAYEHAMSRIRRAIWQVSGKSVIVDSSREPSQALLLTRFSDVELKVLHLVRDSRAVAFSYSRSKLQFAHGSARRYLPRRGAIRSAMVWAWRNLWSSGIARLQDHGVKYTRLRYEDLVRAPAESVAAALADLGMDKQDLSFIDGTTVRIGSNHAISANPVKFNSGTITLRLDDEWRSAMAKRDRQVVTLLTLPLMRRYGYSV